MSLAPMTLEEQLVSEVRQVCVRALKEEITPTHAGVNPKDYPEVVDIATEGQIIYAWVPKRRYVQVVEDERVPRGQANVCNHAAAFVAGYVKDMYSDEIGEP